MEFILSLIFLISILAFEVTITSLIAVSNSNSIVHYRCNNCTNSAAFNNDNSSYFNMYLQLASGMCSHPSGSSGCIEWTNTEYWQNFQDIVTREYPDQTRIAEQAHDLEGNYDSYGFAALMLAIAGTILGVFKCLLRLCCRNSIPVIAYIILFGIMGVLSIAKCVLQFIQLNYANTEHDINYADQLLYPGNWQYYLECESVDKQRHLSYYYLLAAGILSLFVGAGVYGGYVIKRCKSDSNYSLLDVEDFET